MNFMSRAWLYIIRKKGKSILLFIILLIMATFVLTALALGNASDTAQQNLRKSLGGEFLVGFDYSENNPYMKVESVEGGTIFYSTQQITPKMVEQIRKIEGIKSCSATVENLANCPSLQLFTGTIPIEEQFRQSTKAVGVWKSEENVLFASGKLTLAEGRHLTPDDQMKALISKDLADKNGLQVGDTIQTDKGVSIEIAGLFHPQRNWGSGRSGYFLLQNTKPDFR